MSDYSSIMWVRYSARSLFILVYPTQRSLFGLAELFTLWCWWGDLPGWCQSRPRNNTVMGGGRDVRWKREMYRQCETCWLKICNGTPQQIETNTKKGDICIPHRSIHFFLQPHTPCPAPAPSRLFWASSRSQTSSRKDVISSPSTLKMSLSLGFRYVFSMFAFIYLFFSFLFLLVSICIFRGRDGHSRHMGDTLCVCRCSTLQCRPELVVGQRREGVRWGGGQACPSTIHSLALSLQVFVRFPRAARENEYEPVAQGEHSYRLLCSAV